MIGLTAILLAGPAAAQGNIDAGKSPAQIFADTCAGCHRSPGQVKRASASFLRSHYTTGSDEAAVMARYLANVPNEPRSQQKKEAARPRETPAESVPSSRRGEPKEQARGPAGSSRGRRTGSAEAKSSATASAASTPAPTPTPEIKPPEPPVEAPPPPPPPALEPFEE